MNFIKTNIRRESINEMLEQYGRVNIIQLAEHFNVSTVTIRNDLNEMEKLNLLQRVHSGAVSLVSANRAYYKASLNERMKVHREEKMKIAKICVSLVEDGDTIMIDSGTTNIYIAKELTQRTNLTVVTNAFFVAQELLYNPSVKVIMLGGDVEPYQYFTYGVDTIAQLQKFRADKLFLSTDGISVDYGLTTSHHQEVEVCRQMLTRTNKVIVVADNSKIGREGFSFVAPLTKIHALATDANIQNNTELQRIKDRNITIINP